LGPPPQKPYALTAGGALLDAQGRPVKLDRVDATAVAVAHLAPHVATFALDATDSVRILIAYSGH
jgi:hypothetical protein